MNKTKYIEKAIFSKRVIKSFKEEIPKDKMEGFLKVSKNNSLSKFSIVSSAFSFLIKKYFENFQDVIKVYPSNAIGLEKIVLLEVKNNAAVTFKDLLQNTVSEVKEVIFHKDYTLPGINLELYSNFSIQFNPEVFYAQDDISLLYEETDSQIVFTVFYNEIYPEYVITGFLNNFISLISDYDLLLSSDIRFYSLIDDKERKQLLVDFNATSVDYPKDKTIVDLFENQVSKTPENVAAVFEGVMLTYKELNEKANQLAHYIRDNYSIDSGEVIGTLLPKSIDLLVSLLAIEKLGCIYLPIAVNYPKDRINYILKDSYAKILLSEEETIQSLSIDRAYVSLKSAEVELASTDNLHIIIQPHDVAYLIYTSGSTGDPKGVLVEHHSNINMSLDQIKTFGVSSKDKVIWFASTAFDASISEIMMSLYTGATLCIPSEEVQKDKQKFIAFLEKNKATIITFPPSYLDLLKIGDLGSLKTIITAGESANLSKAREIYDSGRNYFNAYGPTEYSVCTSIYKLDKDKIDSTLPIGRPISNTSVYILDEYLNVVPTGVLGKL
ncbi:AMP-binding protein, partial [Chryseobacterium sp. G0240]|uniref:AMP-binding protein n=1 Tax=Chryseobacterium sp. G0240 TaxID=2487066 RepID=UPI00161AAF10